MKRGLLKKCFVLVFGILYLVFINSVSAATINAASCSYSDVSSAISSASAGDTVNVPAGSCTWSSTLSISKSIELIGAGSSNTIITCGGSDAFSFTSASASDARVSGFKFVGGGFSVNSVPVVNFRVDHNIFDSSAGFSTMAIDYYSKSVWPQGLIDNNELINIRIVVSACRACSYNDYGDFLNWNIWSDETGLGNEKAVYIEHNTFTKVGQAESNFIDGNYAGSYVVRYNSISGQYAEVHSIQADNRAVRKWEFYGNTLVSSSSTSTQWEPYRIRAATGVVWGETFSGYTESNSICLDNVRSYTVGGSCDSCDGTSICDGNSDSSGWLCRDQPGAGADSYTWTDWNNPPTQMREPIYVWDNSRGISVINNGEVHIQADRDYYNQASGIQTSPTSPFDGTSGTGWGTLANRPTTCTIGVGYWATDQGEWNSEHSGADGQLYKCTSTNTWTLYYQPYPYPHPYTEEGAGNDVKDDASVDSLLILLLN